MKTPILVSDRRALLKGAAALGALQVASPFVVPVRAADNVKMGMVDPLTGVYAAPAGNEVMGAKLAVDQINAKGGILGRQVELLVEDSANDVGTGVQKARKLIERDNVNFIIGDVNSGIAAAIAQVTAEKRVLHVVSGGHTDTITGKDCHWNVYRVCNTTRMEANSVSELLYNKYGKKWHFITPDYAFGHTLYDACAANLKKLGGTVTGNELTPLGTTDFSAYLIKARAANPDVILNLAGTIPLGILVAKKSVQLGMKAPLVQGMNFVVESYPPLVPQAIDQSYFAGSKMMVDLPPSDPLYANITAFRKKYSEMRGASAKPNGNTITVPDILLMVQKVTQGMGAKVLDPEALRTAIESAHDIPELQGIWNLSPTNHGNSFAAGTVVLTNVRGEWKLAQ